MAKDNYISVLEYSRLTGLTQQAIYKKINNKQIKFITRGGKKLVAPPKNIKHVDPPGTNTTETGVILLLQDQLAIKDKQIEHLTQLLANKETQLNNLLEQKQLTYTPSFKDRVRTFFQSEKK